MYLRIQTDNYNATKLAVLTDDRKNYVNLCSLRCLLYTFKEQPEDIKDYADTNERLVDFARVNIPLQNFDEFLDFYNIVEDDNMYLATEDSIAVW